VSNVPENLVYTAEHEYVARTDDPRVVRVGITDYAQGELGDVIFVDLPKAGAHLTSHQTFGTIEAVKAVSELFSPVEGEVAEINAALEADAALVNRDPYGDGWMVKLKIAGPGDLKGLMSPGEYRAHIGE
jgi:glycine cleavage system H protein